MAIRIAINGFGRIGRLTTRILLEQKNVEIIAINDLTDIETLAHLFQYDTAHRKYPGEVRIEGNLLHINGHPILALAEKDPALLPWKSLGIDLVLECTGINTTQEKAQVHIQAGARKVLISAPADGGDIQTLVSGVNDHAIRQDINIYSNASCTTNCLAPLIKVVDELYQINYCLITTTHAYTQDQRLQDAPHKDLRRARAAAMNIIPTTTGAGKAVALVYPPIQGKIHAIATRVPVITGSLVDVVAELQNIPASVADFNAAIKKAALAIPHIIEYSEAPLVSSDIIGNSHSAIFDAPFTMIMGNLVKFIAWYDNEYGYSNRLAGMAIQLGS